MNKSTFLIAFIILALPQAHAQNFISQVKEGVKRVGEENTAMQKVKEIQNKSTWRSGDDWFYNIAKERENSYLIQQVKITPQKGLTNLPQIATLSIHVDSSGLIKDEKVDYFAFPIDVSMGSYLDKGIISRDRGGLLGAAVGSVPDGCSGGFLPTILLDDLASNVFPRYFEWEKIAQEKNVSPFIKYFDGRKYYDTWDSNRGVSNVVKGHGGGEEVDEKRFQALKNKMLNEFEENVKKTSLQGGGFAPSTEIRNAALKVSCNPGKEEYVDELNKAVAEQRKVEELRVYNEAKNQGIIRDIPYVPAVTASDPAFEQTGWVFIWKEGKAYSYKIDDKKSFNALNLFYSGGRADAEIAILAGGQLLSNDDVNGFRKAYAFLQEIRNDASKHISEFAAMQGQQSSQQEALFK